MVSMGPCGIQHGCLALNAPTILIWVALGASVGACSYEGCRLGGLKWPSLHPVLPPLATTVCATAAVGVGVVALVLGGPLAAIQPPQGASRCQNEGP